MTQRNILLVLILPFLLLIPVVVEGAGSPGPHDPTTMGIDCVDCHPVQSWGGPPRGAAQEALCRSCHNLTGMASSMVDFDNHVVNGGFTTIDCGTCHDVHWRRESVDSHVGGVTAENLKLIRARRINKYYPAAVYPAVFQQKPAHFAFNTAPYNGICQACHTATQHHRNDGTNPYHQLGIGCTICHSHKDAFWPKCIDCHDQPQAGRRKVLGAGGDFEKTSHHITGAVEDSDCVVCHYTNNHQLGIVRLYDPDDRNTIINYNPANPSTLETFCINCHDADGASDGNGLQPFSDGQAPPNIKGTGDFQWASSAHNWVGYALNGGNPIGCFGNGITNGCHGNGHGSDNIKILTADAGVGTIDQLCYQCHTEGRIVNHALSNNRSGGFFVADDIEEAFSKSHNHNLGTTFTIDGDTFTLQCTTCHNPHAVTGQYWWAESNLTPITRPDFTDPVNNPRAMGSAVWGDAPGEKMDDFAAMATGTGGLYFNLAHGYVLGATGLQADQPAVYQPRKDDSGYNFEFDGDVLPDYTTLCLDCHSYRMSDGVPPVNWGQGIACTGNSVDPPNQRVTCGTPHGLASANTSSYISDEGTAGFWGTSGNPDVMFDMAYVTRGRHNGHFMRWPYDSADRGAGINFVMSCTDCHESHGSNGGGMMRAGLNGDGGNWNSFCNTCHYYYGGQHAGMSCGNASCHEANSIHRIVKNGGGGGRQLMLTSAGYEANYIPPDFTPEIESVTGHINSDQLTVNFRPSEGTVGIFANQDLTGSLDAQDFWFFDVIGDNPKTITNVVHEPGAYSATLTLSAPLIAADMNTDTLAARPASIWDYYTGGYVNAGTGTLGAEVVSAGPWPVAIDGPPPVAKEKAAFEGDQIYLRFTEGVWGTGAGGSIAVTDLALSDCSGRSIINVDHVAGEASAIITLDGPLTLADVGVCWVLAASNSIHDAYGNYVGAQSILLSLSDKCPQGGPNGEVYLNLNEGVATPYSFDDEYRLVGTVGNPAISFPGSGKFQGDEDQATYIDFDNNDSCLQEADTITMETRVFMDVVDLDYFDGDGDGVDDDDDPDEVGLRNSTQQRVFERYKSVQFTIFRGNWAGDGVAARAGKARVILKYRVDAASRHTCPDPHFPDDPYVGDSAWWHQVATDIDQWPIVQGHWYRIRIVYNSFKTYTPIDIWMDDQGTDGNDTGELWSGFVNAARPDPVDNGGCRWGPIAGETIDVTSAGFSAIGDNLNHTDVPGDTNNTLFKGKIDWFIWKPIADYDGVDDGPHYGP
jgi:predicted CXXCH cytochrome family protein